MLARAGSAEEDLSVIFWLLAVGVVLALAGLASLVQLFVLGAAGSDLAGVYGAFDTPEAMPGVIFVIAMVPLFIGELLRRAKWQVHADSTFFRGGMVTVASQAGPAWVVVGGLLVAVAAWIWLVAVPVFSYLDGSGFAAASDQFWLVCGLYGFVAAAIAGVLLITLVKRAAFTAVARRGRTAPDRGRDFWKFVSGQWRAESWLGGLGLGFIGAIPLLFQDAVRRDGDLDTTAVTVFAVLGGGMLVAGAVVATQSWRTGEAIGYAESVA